MRASLWVSAIVVAGMLGGCGATGPKIVGKWSGSVTENGIPMPIVAEYKADKSFVGTLEVPTLNVKIEMTGTYEGDDKAVTTTITGSRVIGELPAQFASVKTEMEKELAKEIGKSTKETLEWVSDDEVKITQDTGETATFTRIKEEK